MEQWLSRCMALLSVLRFQFRNVPKTTTARLITTKNSTHHHLFPIFFSQSVSGVLYRKVQVWHYSSPHQYCLVEKPFARYRYTFTAKHQQYISVQQLCKTTTQCTALSCSGGMLLNQGNLPIINLLCVCEVLLLVIFFLLISHQILFD